MSRTSALAILLLAAAALVFGIGTSAARERLALYRGLRAERLTLEAAAATPAPPTMRWPATITIRAPDRARAMAAALAALRGAMAGTTIERIDIERSDHPARLALAIAAEGPSDAVLAAIARIERDGGFRFERVTLSAAPGGALRIDGTALALWTPAPR